MASAAKVDVVVLDVPDGALHRLAIVTRGSQSQFHQPDVTLTRPCGQRRFDGARRGIERTEIHLRLRQRAYGAVVVMPFEPFGEQVGICNVLAYPCSMEDSK